MVMNGGVFDTNMYLKKSINCDLDIVSVLLDLYWRWRNDGRHSHTAAWHTALQGSWTNPQNTRPQQPLRALQTLHWPASRFPAAVKQTASS